jgi:hypothetical protein
MTPEEIEEAKSNFRTAFEPFLEYITPLLPEVPDTVDNKGDFLINMTQYYKDFISKYPDDLLNIIDVAFRAYIRMESKSS